MSVSLAKRHAYHDIMLLPLRNSARDFNDIALCRQYRRPFDRL
jgi:hypothetical protein